ncbi:MAG: glycosyltransferase family 4 protein [Dolichospermum sp. JUN01]|nr:glycosyltransferase family 4 protein [Dolichospermum sp. JUN01]MBS9392910.1 glycosyltransferase family 4 protein [Dolichospermum sp. OL01]MCO5796545.1 glycosyltransferase family 4 protein [Dolichospermum sp. OL03]MCS6283335.1 glycosyltransferase family 4 protein [Dolichospermum sp.]QSV58147.1 MAG: glycosyltransferase family 4 protein [Dolichospermum sp. LBC05a]
MLKIIIDATPIDPKPSGIGFYVANLISALNQLQTDENFQLGIVYQPGLTKWLRGDLSFPDSLKHYTHRHVLPLPVRITDLLLASSFKPGLSYFEKYFDAPDILHGTNYSVYPCKNSLKVMNIYDLTFIKYPQYIDSVVKTYTEKVRRCLQWTDLVLTISESSKQDIIEYLQVAPEKISVTPLASRYHPDYLSEEQTDKLAKQVKYDFSIPYILFVSTIEPRKNINTIITAFNLLKQKYKIKQQLILIGRKGWNYESIFTAIEASPWKQEIHHLDYLSDELVALFYSKADVFVYPSHYEGFGLPVLEAMTLGAPVITAKTSSLPEVTGNAAILIEPQDSVQIAESILEIISNSQLRQELINKGKERAKLFSWERTAKTTLTAYRRSGAFS